jgi:protein-tyrosine phosphatase/arsenate reductase
MKNSLFEPIQDYCDARILEFDQISELRKTILEQISMYIVSKRRLQSDVQLLFVCTHNSRRSHFGQIWATIAATYFDLNHIFSYSCGTETTSMHPNAMAALFSVGMKIDMDDSVKNPICTVSFGEKLVVTCFSKTFNHLSLPKSNFSAIMTCSEAEENCPYIPGVDFRIATSYEDPKHFDGTTLEKEKYDERCRQIACEMLYVMYFTTKNL